MIAVLDAYALIALALDEPAAEEVARLLTSGDAGLTSVNYGETIDQLVRVGQVPEPRVRAIFEPLLDGPLKRVDVDFALIARAVRLRIEHYHRKRCPLSLADCICVATADGLGGAVATADEAMLAVAESEGIATVALAPARA